MTLVVRPALFEDVAVLAPRLRAADVAEVAASSGRTPAEALRVGLQMGRAWTVFLGGEPVAMYGFAVVSLAGGTASPWLLGTEAVSEHPWVFGRQARRVVDAWLQIFPRMQNFVDARHTAAVRWLEWLGFTLEPARPHGVLGLPFHRFTMERPDV